MPHFQHTPWKLPFPLSRLQGTPFPNPLGHTGTPLPLKLGNPPPFIPGTPLPGTPPTPGAGAP
eukprot:1605452-Karenia_brevis.AAC.1